MTRVLILLALCASMAMGQKTISWSGDWSYHFQGALDSVEHITTVGKDTSHLPPYTAVTVLSILQLYTAYERECYNDSTLSRFHIIHRQPTFPGFMEWLRKRVK